jgi:hypothetical protein
MARYALQSPHYLNCPDTEWEQIEIGATGKQIRHRYKVHRLLDPSNPDDITDKSTGQIIVSTKEDPQFPNDILFIGAPSNEMIPLDAEAEELIAKVLARPHPMSEAALPTTAAVLAAHPAAPAGPDPMAEIKAMMAELAAQNAELQAQLSEMKLRQQEAASEEDDSVGDIPAPKPQTISLGGANA